MRRALPVLGLIALAGVAVSLVALLVFGRSSEDSAIEVPIPADAAPRIQANAVLTPRTVGFGDTVRARVDVTLNGARVDPASVRVATDFSPWTALGEPERVRRDGESTTHLRSTWTLRCLASACLPPAQPLRLLLTPATVTYDSVGQQAEPDQPLTAAWPVLVVHTRLAASVIAPPTAGSPFESPWRADMVTMPPVSYRVEPDVARLPIFAAAGGFALLGLGLAYVGRPRRRPKVAAVPEEPPPPVLTPIELALSLLEDPMSEDGASDRRRALELVAAELAGRGNHDLAYTARRLAWSRQSPEAESTTPFAEQLRPVLGLDEEAEAGEVEAEGAEAEEAKPSA